MRVLVIGAGYVGLVSAVCFAEMGNYVICVDSNQAKIHDLQKGIIPIYEPGLDVLLSKNYQKHLFFSVSLQAVLDECEIVFIAVGTPMGEDGQADVHSVLEVAKEIGQSLQKPMLIVTKSTVPVGTTHKVKALITQGLRERGIKVPIAMISNPEFLKEGCAIKDFLSPDRVIFGYEDEQSLAIMKELYSPFVRNHQRFICMSILSAEMTKYAANAMLATKISFINEMANLCEALGADINEVRIGIGSDKRIGYDFIYAGCGFGGSCFPKDIQALLNMARAQNMQAQIIQSVYEVNEHQKQVLSQKVINHFGDVANKTFAIWGISFKPETDDLREAPSLRIIDDLCKLHAKIQIYDPKAMELAKAHYLRHYDIQYFQNKYDVLDGCDALLLITEWKEFRSPDFKKIKQRLNCPIIFDGRNQYDAKRLKELGFLYYQIGVRAC